jgi:hypothetical protein
MIKRTFTSDSYDQAFSEQAIKSPSFSEEFINKFNGTQAQLFYSKYRVLLLNILNLACMLALLIFTTTQFRELHQQIDEGQRKVSKLEASLKVIQESWEKDGQRPSTVNESKLAFELKSELEGEHESGPSFNDPNIKYLGLIHSDHSFKALLEVDEVTSFFGKGQMIEDRWLIKSFDHSQMILESTKGQAMTILLEK